MKTWREEDVVNHSFAYMKGYEVDVILPLNALHNGMEWNGLTVRLHKYVAMYKLNGSYSASICGLISVSVVMKIYCPMTINIFGPAVARPPSHAYGTIL